LISTKGAYVAQITGAGRGDHARTDVFGKLDRKSTNAPRSAVNENLFVWPQSQRVVYRNDRR